MLSYNEFAKIYDKLINEDIDYDKISDKILKSFKKYCNRYNTYLDLAGGTGNVSYKISDKFKNTFLVDISEDMLIEAEEKFRSERKKVKIVCQDMCELNLNRKFDLITCVLDSTNYITNEDSLQCYFKCVYEHLEDHGVFIFDINSYYKLSKVLGNNIYTYNSEDVFYTWENIFEDEIVEMCLTFFVKKGEVYERFEEIHEEKAYKEEYIQNLLKEIGFEILEKNDGYSDLSVKNDTERILYVLRKKS